MMVGPAHRAPTIGTSFMRSVVPVFARAFLAEQIGKFTLERVSEDGAASFRANNQIDLAKMRLHAWMVPGARIELATPAFSGRRSTSELPRHDAHKV
jgi:hypothetical protein